jgi:probable phosphoglycerate mutase
MADSVVDGEGLSELRRRAAAQKLEPAVDVFLFLRHGRTRGNAQRIFQRPDEPLDDHGVGQAERAAAILSGAIRNGAAFSHIMASTMARAWQTAGIVATATERKVTAHDPIRERYFGDFIGTSSAAIDWRVSPPNGETLDGFITRTAAGLASALATGGTPLVVAHGGTLHCLAGLLHLELTPDILQNAVPLLLTRSGSGWTMRPVGAVESGGAVSLS